MQSQPADDLQETMAAHIAARLRQAAYREVWLLRCELLGDEILLSGRVPSYYLKQVALQITMEVTAGVVALHDQIEVRPA